MSLPANDVLFRGDSVLVNSADYVFAGIPPEPERRLFVHTTMRQGDSDVELCDNPYRSTPATLDYLPVTCVRLVRRGNWFRARHNMQLQFDDPYDELLFWRYYIGVHEVRNPENQTNSWTRNQALNALSARIADLFVAKENSLNPAGEYLFVGYKFQSDSIPGGTFRLRELNREALRAMAS